MAKHNERHLATEQLSAFLDNQLSSEEQSTVEAHLQNCQQCQDVLAGLRQTVALLHALPQPDVPRSFALSPGVSYLQERPQRQDETQQRQREPVTNRTGQRKSGLYYIQRTMRVASALVAVIGLFFLLSTVLPAFPHGGASSATSGSVPSATSPFTRNSGTHAATGTARKLTPNEQGATPAATPATPSNSNQKTPDIGQSPVLLPDVTTLVGRQELGLLLLALGIIGALLTRRRRLRRT